MSRAGDIALQRLADRLAPLAATLLPPYPELSAAARETVEREVARYVASLIAAMPDFLRIPYRGALLLFELLPMVRYGARFRDLPTERRAACLALWSDAPVAVMRDFVRLIRSTALLVYFDHPTVREKLEAERRDAAGARGAAGA